MNSDKKKKNYNDKMKKMPIKKQKRKQEYITLIMVKEKKGNEKKWRGIKRKEMKKSVKRVIRTKGSVKRR